MMKEIFQGLIAMQLQTTWQEIFEFRETHIGNLSAFPLTGLLFLSILICLFFSLHCRKRGTSNKSNGLCDRETSASERKTIR